mgnify:CR=1 FL=1
MNVRNLINASTDNQWTTDDEIDFIRRLGTHQPRYMTPPPTISAAQKVAMWRAYRAQMPQRVNWGDIDSLAVLDALDALIQKAEVEVKLVLDSNSGEL